jgi:hypothetical protein
MITALIGPNGRLGNQMFQYAALLGIATKQNLQYGVNYNCGDSRSWKDFPRDDTFYLMTLDKCFNLSAPQINQKNLFRLVEENGAGEFNFQPRFFECGDNVLLKGFFQTHRYFEHIESWIRKEFTFKPEIIEAASKYLRPGKETVSIHIRRGDYIQAPWHGLCDAEYYRKAQNIFVQDTNKTYDYIYITDDPEFVESQIRPSESVRVCRSGNQFLELCLMSMCHHNIIANSTFSWWGSWLNSNPNKKVIAPSVWFRQHLAEANISDLYQKNWIII